MADILSISIIMFLNLLSIAFGFISAQKFIKAYLDHRDLYKYQKDLVSAFLMIIIFPIFITFIGFKITDIGEYNSAPIALVTTSKNSDYGNGRLYFKDNNLNVRGLSTIQMSIYNEFDEKKEFNIKIGCVGSQKKCDKALGVVLPQKQSFNIQPVVYFELPIIIDIKEEMPKGKYNFNITVTQEDEFYDSTIITVAVE